MFQVVYTRPILMPIVFLQKVTFDESDPPRTREKYGLLMNFPYVHLWIGWRKDETRWYSAEVYTGEGAFILITELLGIEVSLILIR